MERSGDVCIVVQLARKVEVLDVDAHKAGIAGAEYTVEHEFGGGDVGGFASFVALVIDTITTGSPSNTLGVWLFGAVGANNTNVGWSFVFRDFMFVDKVHGVGSSWHW